MGVGACTLSNTPNGVGDAMIQRRIEGKSWAEIAEEFGLPNPGAARSKFTKLTGITDYKIKGKELKKLVDSNMLDSIKGASAKVAKKAVKQVDEAVKVSNAFDLPPTGPASPGPSQALLREAQKAQDDLKAAIAKIHADSVIDAKNHIDDLYGVLGGKVEDIWAEYQNGVVGYLKLSNKYGVKMSDVDDIIWNNLVKQERDIWKAYIEKPTSETGFKTVQKLVYDLRSNGMTLKEVADLTGVDADVVKLIMEGKWKMPTPGSLTYVKTASNSYGGSSYQYTEFKKETTVLFEQTNVENYSFVSETRFVEWANQNANMPSEVFNAVRRYTGSSYREINGGLRKAGTVTDTVRNIDRAMIPLPFDTRVVRYVGTDTFDSLGGIDNIGGKVFKDRGFFSTAVHTKGTFSSYPVRIEVDLPAGTPSRYVDTFSAVKGEKELIVQREQDFIVTSVTKETTPYGLNYLIKMKALL
jgi:hypothetical protein